MPDAGIIGHPPTLSQEHSWFRRRQKMFRHVIRGSLSLVSVPDRYRLPFPQRSRQWLFAAWGGLKPAPESRLRYPSSSIQRRKPDGPSFGTHDPLILHDGKGFGDDTRLL